MDLILRITGTVQESNLSGFEKSARAFLDNINKTLVTDQDFGTAKLNIAECQNKETQIENAKQKAIMSMAEVNAILTTADKFSAEIRDTRLMLNKLVKTEEAARKKEITDTGIDEIKAAISRSGVSHGFMFDPAKVIAAIKGMRSLEKMEESVNSLVDDTLNDLSCLVQTYVTNIAAIDKCLEDTPGLFPDSKTVALQPVENVALMISARVNEHKIALIEKARQDAERAKEADRIALEKAEIPEPVAEIKHPPASFEPAKETELPSFDDIPVKTAFWRVEYAKENSAEIYENVLNVRGVIRITKEVSA